MHPYSAPSEGLLRQILAYLAQAESPSPDISSPDIPEEYHHYVCDWLKASHLAPMAYSVLGKSIPPIGERLRDDYYGAVVRYERQNVYLHNFLRDFNKASIPVLLLKGVSIVPIVYGEPYHRFMSDIDIAVPTKRLGDAWDSLQGDLVTFTKPDRVDNHLDDGPATDADGKLELQAEQYHDVQLDVHTTIFPGYWIDIASKIDEAQLWERAIDAPIESFKHLKRLSNEDLLLHIMIHAAINHQFDRTALRNFIDFYRLTQQLDIDWATLCARAREWRVSTTVWFYLFLYHEIMSGCFPVQAEIAETMRQLAPSLSKQRALSRFISRKSILELDVLRHSRKRYFFLSLLVDRPGDLARLLVSIPFIYANRSGT